MKSTRILNLAAATLVAIASTTATAATYKPQALRDVKKMALATEGNGEQPVAIFDLDDTLINTRDRNLRIINDFIAQADIQARYPDESKNLAELTDNEISYLMADTLKARSVTNPAFLKEISDFWLARFFTNEYCSNDKPNPGAVKYVRRLYLAGVKIVYLTGRDIPRMHDGTLANLQKLGLPVDDDQAILMMKPDPKQDDLEYKKSMFPVIAQMGTVVGVFENEPANINAHHDAFPNAIAVFLDTIHSPKPDVPEQEVFWVQDFKSH
jgi:histidinol phosphatase-like enzyme